MTGLDVLVVVVFFVIGYVVFSAVWDKLKGKPPAAPAPTAAVGPTPWHEVLQIAPDAPSGEIDAAYLALLKKYEADRRADPRDEFKALAAERIAALERAYREALAARSGN
jgi:hypothetical protein